MSENLFAFLATTVAFSTGALTQSTPICARTSMCSRRRERRCRSIAVAKSLQTRDDFECEHESHDNPLSGTLNSGEIKILSSAPPGGLCNAASSYKPATGSFSVTEVSFPAGVLGTTELSHLQTTCAANQSQGSGFGIFSCGLE
jgi:hypothetical protein